MQVFAGTSVEDFNLMKSLVPRRPVVDALDELVESINLVLPPDDEGVAGERSMEARANEEGTGEGNGRTSEAPEPSDQCV